MGLFDDIPMAGDVRVRRQGGFDPAAGQMSIPADPPEDEDLPEWSDPVRLAQSRALPLPLPGIPGGTGVSPDAWDQWRKGAIKGIMDARALYRRTIGSFSGGGDDEDCKKERQEAHKICRDAYANGWQSDYDVGPYRKPSGGRWSLEDCMRGFMSARCGGNKPDPDRGVHGKK